MARTRIKICGVRDLETALVACECGADAIGLVFVKSSPRFVEPAAAWSIVDVLPPFVASVGLFVNPTTNQFTTAREACPFDFAQLHGEENEPTVRACAPWVIKAVRYDPATIELELRKWSMVGDIHAMLVDGSAGGQGKALDWDGLARVSDACAHPLILAGGLTPENVGEAISIVRPYAVDVSSGVESAPGEKDPVLIDEFCRAVREADAALSRA